MVTHWVRRLMQHKPSVSWQDASTIDVEALVAAIDELEARGGTKDFEIFGAKAFDAAGWATEGIGTDGFGLMVGFFFIAFLGPLALPLPPASVEAFVAPLNSSTTFLACFANLA